jgi:hypothetical protein
MLDDMKKYVRAGLEALSSPGAEEAAGVIATRASVLAEQLSSFASGFREWSAEARASLLQEVKDLVARQIETMGLATKQDVETLRRRIDRLEGRAAGSRSAGSRSAGSRSAKSGTRASTRPKPATRGSTSRPRRPAPE